MQSKTGMRQWTSRLFAWSLVLALLPLAGATFLTYRDYQRAASELIVERDLQLAYLSASRLRDELFGFADILSTLARTPEIYRKNVADQQSALHRAENRLAVFDAGVVLLDNFGKVRATVPERPAMLRQDWSSRPFFRKLLGSSRIAFSDANYDPEKQAFTITVGVPIIGERGEFVGALAGEFDLGESRLSPFYASIIRLRIGQSGTTYIIDGTGRILYDSDQTEMGKVFDVEKLSGRSLNSIGGAKRTHDAEDHDIVAAYVPIPGTGWTLVTEDDWATVTATTRRYGNMLLALIAVGTILPSVGITLLTQHGRNQTREQEHLQEAKYVAGVVHRTLLPRHVPMLPGWNITVHHQPADTIRGDFYDYLVLPDGRLMLTIGDVSDSSTAGAVMTATTRAILRSAALDSLSPGVALARGNALLCPHVQERKMVACTYAILDPASGRLDFANAGQPPLFRLGNGEPSVLDGSRQPLGITLAVEYHHHQVTMEPGDCVLFLTDGVIGARNPQGEPFGAARLTAFLQKQKSCGQQVLDALLAELVEFTGDGWAQEDDITLITLERTSDTHPV